MTANNHEPWEWAAGSAATVLAWYALPDLVRSRTARGLVKVGLLGATTYGAALVPGVWPETSEIPGRVEAQLTELPRTATIGILSGGIAALTAATILFEKYAFARGERRRAKGVRCAHTRQAVAIAAATAALAFVKPPSPAD